MLFVYKAIEKDGSEKLGTIEAVTLDVAINSLQRRGLVISSIDEQGKGGSILNKNFTFLDRVKMKDVVMLSRQISTLFQAQVSALRIFKLLAAESESPKLQKILGQVVEDLQGGSSISNALPKHSEVFSTFYISMVKAGEETGKLDETFQFLADYLERNYELTSKAKNALVYPAFVIFTFVAVMVLMLTMVIPKIGAILTESGQEIPFYTRLVLGLSDFFVTYGMFLLIGVIVAAFFGFKFIKTGVGRESFDEFKLSIPYIGDLYQKLYLSRISDNLNTMLVSGIPMVKALELTQSVVDNQIYLKAIDKILEDVKAGIALSDAFSKHTMFPNIMIQMIKVGEESGKLGEILETLSRFYRREVSNAVDTLVGLIEPVMIIFLGVGVGGLLAAILIPIYNVSATF